jgi:hypothetical protein
VYLPKAGKLWKFLKGDRVLDNPNGCRVVDFPKVRKSCGHFQRERYIITDITKGRQIFGKETK